MRIAIIPAIAACTAAVVTTASPARADDHTFIQQIRSNGIGTGIMDDSTTTQLGHFMCDRMRNGATPEDVAQLPRGPFIDGIGIAHTAQHELCPDTLH